MMELGRRGDGARRRVWCDEIEYVKVMLELGKRDRMRCWYDGAKSRR